MTARRRRLSWLLVLLFLVMPLAELFVIIQVGQLIGVWWTILLLIADSVIGAWIVRREGARAWTALQNALAAGKMPSTEIADGALILLGGAMMLTPGFVTDILGVVLMLPLTRPFFRRILATVVQKRLVTATMPSTFGPRARPTNDDIVTGEVVDKDNLS